MVAAGLGGRIRTPFCKKRPRQLTQQNSCSRSRKNHLKRQGEEQRCSGSELTGKNKQRHEEEESLQLSTQILSVAMTDPMTMMHDTWSYLTLALQPPPQPPQHLPRASPAEGVFDEDDDGDEHEEWMAHDDPYDAYDDDDGGEKRTCNSCKGTPHNARPQSAIIWNNVCILHTVGALRIGLMLLPSIVSPSMLACKKSAHSSSAWPMVNSSALMLGI
jgi:hypothetical protein